MLNHAVTTSQQMNTLLGYLKTQTTPPDGMLFFEPLMAAKLDDSPESIVRLSQLLTQLQGYLVQKHITLDTLATQPQSRAFFLTVASYLGNYLAKSCDETLRWYNYFEARTEIDKKNRLYKTNFQLEHAFENSVLAKIGDNMYVQPLRAVQMQLARQGTISEFVANMRQGIFKQAQINIMAEPNQVCRDYLQKVQTGRLLDSTFGFFEPLKSLVFDYSVTSLAHLDTILAQIKQIHQLNAENYQVIITQPAHQATLYLLGFYIGMTCARVTNTPVIWANYQQIYRTLIYANPNAGLVDCIEHSFVMVVQKPNHSQIPQAPQTEKCFVAPIAVVTQMLFGIADSTSNLNDRVNLKNLYAITTSTAFFHDFEQNFVKKNNPSSLAFYPYPSLTPTTEMPKLWQIALQSASGMLNNHLMQIFDGSDLEPQIFELDPITKKGSIEPVTTLGKTSAADYLKHNPKQSPMLVATHDTLINLPTGQCHGIAMDIAVYHESPESRTLRLRLVLPYRPADDKNGFAIYPLILTELLAQPIEIAAENGVVVGLNRGLSTGLDNELAKALITQFYQFSTAFVSPLHEGNFWQNYYIEPINSAQKSPLSRQLDTQYTDKIDLALLPVAPIAPLESSIEPSLELSLEPSVELSLEPTLKTNLDSTIAPMSEAINEAALVPVVIETPISTKQNLSDSLLSESRLSNSCLSKNTATQSVLPNADLTSTIPTRSLTKLPEKVAEKTLIKTPKKAQISAELLTQLNQDKARLQRQLSTSDGAKDRKIILTVGGTGVLLVLLLLGVWVMK